ncbi:hypothetical protein [Desulfocurvus vexinensis]|uniref:hypothetical protein n=1 Tax=Desulfocurvus vexinensis TaxID=399548 RepID=UPI000491DBBB|nr:hypothetical protein [Desulfocurvus vexinensis]
MTYPCATCEYRAPLDDPTPGAQIPAWETKCMCPTGLCPEARKAWGKDMSPGKGPDSVPEISAARAAQLAQDQNTAAAVSQAVMDVEGVLRDLGRLDATLFYATVADSMLVQIFEKMKKEKAYQKIPIRDEAGNVRHVADLKEFCEVKLGKSYQRLQELSQHMHTLGPDLYEAAERVGFRNRDYRALKALPAEDQEAVKRALAEDATKDDALSLLQDMAERHAAQQAAARKEAEDLAADLDARDRLLQTKAQQLDKTQLELERLKSLPPAQRARLALEREAAAVERLSLAEVKASAAVNEFLGELADLLEADGCSPHTSDYAHNLARYWAEGVGNHFANYGVAVDFEGIVRPEWTRAEAARGLGVADEGATA